MGVERKLAAAMASVLFVLLQLPACKAERGTPAMLLRVAGSVALIAALPWYPGAIAASLAIALAVAMVRRGALAHLEGAIVLGALGVGLAPWFPWLASSGHRLATALGQAAMTATNAAEVSLGPTAAALPAGLWCLIILLPRAGRGAHRADRFAACLGMVGIVAVLSGQWLVLDFLHPRVGFFTSHGHPPEPFRTLDFAVPALCAVVALSFGRGRGFCSSQCIAPGWSWRARRWTLAAATSAVALMLLTGWRGSEDPDRRVSFLNVGGFDWERPTTDKLGVFEAGMFGPSVPTSLRH
jgi:hypothetical protein